MRILAFDPGHTTGFALIEDDFILASGSVHFSCNVHTELIELFKPDMVVIESVPQRTVDTTTYIIFSALQSYAWSKNLLVFVITPGLWKPLRQAKNKDFIPHVQDAIGLAQYAERVYKND